MARWSCKDCRSVVQWLAACCCVLAAGYTSAQEPVLRPGDRSIVRTRPETTSPVTRPSTTPRTLAAAPPTRTTATAPARVARVQDTAPAAPVPRSVLNRDAAVPAGPPGKPVPEELGPEVIDGPPVPEGYVLDLDGDYVDEGFEEPGYMGHGGHACDACGGMGCPNCWFGGFGGLYVRAEMLRWQTAGMHVPALVTTSEAVAGQAFPPPVRNAGVLGIPGTVVLYGDGDILDNTRSGGRIYVGMPIDYERRLTLEGEYFGLEEAAENFSASSNGTPILARPFFNLATTPNNIAAESSELVAYPNVIRGTVAVDASSTFEGAAARLKYLLCCSEGCVPALVRRRGDVPGGYRMELTGGYRYLGLDDNLTIREDLATIPAPGTFDLQDSFQTNNEFHGVELGMLLHTRRGRWTMDWVSRLGIGSTNATSMISGSTIIDDGTGSVTHQGGLLAQTTNIGTYDTSDFAVVPELGVTVGLDVTPRFRLLLGYTMIYWSRVLRAGDQIDREINPNLIPPANLPLVGAARPEQRFVWSDYWAQGLTIGLEGQW